MRAAIFLLIGLIAFVCLFVRTYTSTPAPDRRGGTAVMLAAPTRPIFGSPRGECLGTAESEPVIPCLIASVARAREAGLARVELPFCATCYALSQRIALIGIDEKTARAKQEQIARFGW